MEKSHQWLANKVLKIGIDELYNLLVTCKVRRESGSPAIPKQQASLMKGEGYDFARLPRFLNALRYYYLHNHLACFEGTEVVGPS